MGLDTSDQYLIKQLVSSSIYNGLPVQQYSYTGAYYGMNIVQVYPLVNVSRPNLPIGTVCYFQNGSFGQLRGLLALSFTPQVTKCIVTPLGLASIS